MKEEKLEVVTGLSSLQQNTVAHAATCAIFAQTPPVQVLSTAVVLCLPKVRSIQHKTSNENVRRAWWCKELFLHHHEYTNMAINPWAALLRQYLLNRTVPQDLAAQLAKRRIDEPQGVVKALLEYRQNLCPTGDPLPSRYLEVLLQSHQVAVSDVIVVLIAKYNGLVRASKPASSSDVELSVLQEMSMLLLASQLEVDKSDTQRSLLLLSRWMSMLVRSLAQSPDSLVAPTAEAVGQLLGTVSATKHGIDILSEKGNGSRSNLVEGVRQAVTDATGAYASLSMQLIQRLEVVQTHIARFDETQDQPPAMQAMQIQSRVPQLPVSATPTGTMAYLEALIITARTIDDTIVFNFLAGRHANDWAAMCHDLIAGSFKVLRNCHASHRKALFLPQAQLFVRNKMPAILALISGSSFGLFSMDEQIKSSWNEVKDLNPDLLPAAYQALHVCSLHHLVTAEVVSEIVNDPDVVSKFPKGLYSKDDLVSQVTANHSRVSKLVEELTHADGSAAAITQAIVEMIMAYCQNKETHHLKDLANAIIKNPVAINALSMFIKPSYWLGPLCTLLDEWRWDDIHGESQPVYEEFGSILLLIICCKRRLFLSISQMGMQEGFVARYFDQEGVEASLLSEESNKHLGDWIGAFYIAEGLSDEVTTSCSPQEFYMLVPSLLNQSMLGYKRGKLTLDMLKGGLECEFMKSQRTSTNLDRLPRAFPSAVISCSHRMGESQA
jgi:mediator of RNA polymerase II transcription subunit 5